MKQICNYFCFGSVPNQLIFLAPEKSLSYFCLSNNDCRKVTAIHKIVHSFQKYKQQTKKENTLKKECFQCYISRTHNEKVKNTEQ